MSDSSSPPCDEEYQHSGPTESPLKRPVEADAAHSVVEQPLKRPGDDEEEISFASAIAAFAVDVSGSTEGKVLEEEKAVITSLCSGLFHHAKSQARILPWSLKAGPVLHSNQLNALLSGGGTDPNCMNNDFATSTALRKCSVWSLLTDGEISSNGVRNFSSGLCNSWLHGTPCIIVLFGYRNSRRPRPSSCNVSVGLSVFSNAADFLFLFHDIDMAEVFLLQLKGKFNAILPHGHDRRDGLVFHETTLWCHLPSFT